MLLEEALQKCLFLNLSVHPLASQLAGCVLGLECSLSTCGLENAAVPFLPLLPLLPNATFPRAGRPWAVHGEPVGRFGSRVFEWGCQERCQTSLALQGMLVAPGCSPGLAPSAAGSGTGAVTLGMFMGFPFCGQGLCGCLGAEGSIQPRSAGPPWGDRNDNPRPIPCHGLPAQCVCHISSPGARRAEGTAGNHNGMLSGASQKSAAATFPPLCCALDSLGHLCLRCVVSPEEEQEGVFRMVNALSPPDRCQGHRGPGERLCALAEPVQAVLCCWKCRAGPQQSWVSPLPR